MNDRPKKLLTLAVVHTGTHVLLGMKKCGFGQGLWNGFGGKVQAGEGVREAALRELREEAGIEASDLRKRGTLLFDIATEPELLEVHVFSASGFVGEPIESDEMRPAWFRLTDITFGSMWADDKYWLPLLLAGKDFEGVFYFLDNDNLLHHQLKVTNEPALI